MKISNRNVNMEPQLALDPQVMPFYPRSLLSDSCFMAETATDAVSSDGVFADFARSLEQFCSISDEMSADSRAGYKFRYDGGTQSWETWGVSSDSSATSREQTQESLDVMWTETPDHVKTADWILNSLISSDNKLSPDVGFQFSSSSSPHYEPSGGSKLLDGTWSRNSDSFELELGSDGRSLFGLFHADNDKGSGLSAKSAERNSKYIGETVPEKSNTKYYTPFGSGVSLPDFGRQPIKSCWSDDQVEVNTSAIRRPPSTCRNTNKTIHTDKYREIHEMVPYPPNKDTRAASRQPENGGKTSVSVYQIEHAASRVNDRRGIDSQSRNGQMRDPLGSRGLNSVIPSNYAAPQKPVCLAHGEGGRIVPSERQVLADQQMFMQELNRLPPDLRKQYIDYMIASHHGLVTSVYPSPSPAAVPGLLYNVGIGPSAVPMTQLITPTVIMPGASPFVPTQLVTLQPVITASASKPVPRRTGPANDLHVSLEECHEQFRLLENERKKTEAELARQNPGKSVSSDNSRSLPPMPMNPSRVDRLVVDSLREHAKVTTLVERIEQLRDIKLSCDIHDAFTLWADDTRRVDAYRREEIANAINRHRTRNSSQTEKERDVLALAAALGDLTASLRHARTMLWCSLQLGSHDLPSSCIEAARCLSTGSSSFEPQFARRASSAFSDELSGGAPVYGGKPVPSAEKPITSQGDGVLEICGDDDVFGETSVDVIQDESDRGSAKA